MLFDLRGRGRRRTVQAIYLSLAILMGGGLVLFGVGGATSGGLLDALKSNNTTSNSDVFSKRVKRAETAVRTRPTDERAWAELTRARYLEAGTNFNETQGTFTEKGKNGLRSAESSWDKYLALQPKKPDDQVASLMVQAFGPAGLNKPDKAVGAMEIIVDSREATAPMYVQLAALAYEAGQTRKAELASKKAVEIAPKDDKEQIRAQLEAARTQASAALGDSGSGSATKTVTTPSS
jgi:tetratricopeptide (TPR) repeat protein